MILRNIKLIYIHIPKTGGLSTCKSFNSFDCDHKRIEYYKHMVDVSEYYKFTITRNPWDRMVSGYFYFKNSERITKHIQEKLQYAINGRNFINQFEDFKDFVYFSKNNADIVKSKKMFEDQFIYANDLDYIGTFEELDESINHVRSIMGLSTIKLPHINKSTHLPYREYYDDTTNKIVADIYSEDIDTFKYTF